MAIITYINSTSDKLTLAQELLKLPQEYKFAIAQTSKSILISDTNLTLNHQDIDLICEGISECTQDNPYKTVMLSNKTKVTVSNIKE